MLSYFWILWLIQVVFCWPLNCDITTGVQIFLYISFCNLSSKTVWHTLHLRYLCRSCVLLFQNLIIVYKISYVYIRHCWLSMQFNMQNKTIYIYIYSTVGGQWFVKVVDSKYTKYVRLNFGDNIGEYFHLMEWCSHKRMESQVWIFNLVLFLFLWMIHGWFHATAPS